MHFPFSSGGFLEQLRILKNKEVSTTSLFGYCPCFISIVYYYYYYIKKRKSEKYPTTKKEDFFHLFFECSARYEGF